MEKDKFSSKREKTDFNFVFDFVFNFVFNFAFNFLFDFHQ